MWTNVLLLFLCASAVVSYRIQSPIVEVCPQALRVSIPDSPGVQLFAFHGNINHPIGETEAGLMSKDVTRKTTGRWVFETTAESFTLGDTINYWIYVQHRGLGYRSDVMKYTINAFSNRCEAFEVDSSEEEVQVETQKFGRRRIKGPSGVCFCDKEIQKVNEKLSETRQQLQGAINVTERIKEDFESLNDVLGQMLEKLNYGRKLLLTGVLPPGDNPYELIRTILTDKLDLDDLKLRILNATTTVHGAILFEMTSTTDKFRILLRSKRLERSKIRIINYQDDENEIFPVSSSPAPIIDGPDPAIDVRFGES
ncbi:beta-1,3-glucan-binding protein 2-like isoform X2 [Lutzomyia longipalpis]|uniref:beta-1,3-glucan-binding protein 2-like isoform X2 n=1 Tax=Lutzomyia longipalpis TaxID=7200 RepID=UPI0024838B68|nr:beta-1,3-glucan-binding protein 2-like isoform X2 [Lutzomyia longipalpis]